MNRAARVAATLKQQLAEACARVPVIDKDSAIWQLAQHLVPVPQPMPAPDYSEIGSPAPTRSTQPSPKPTPQQPAARSPLETAMVIAYILDATSTDGWRRPEPGYAAGGQRSAARLQALQAARRKLVKQIYWSLPPSYRHKYSVRTIQRVHEIFCDTVDAKRAPEGLRTVAASTIAADLKRI
jgi:hypothetical protein